MILKKGREVGNSSERDKKLAASSWIITDP